MNIAFKILFFLLISWQIPAQNTYFLEGKLGKSIIYMEITEYDNNYIEGNYFYQTSLKDIRLNGKYNEDSYTLYFGNDYGEDFFEEKFELVKKESNFKGKWKNKAGKSINITLRTIDFDRFKKTFSTEIEEDLSLVKLNYLHFIQDSITIHKNQEIIWFKETHCEVPFFRLGNTFSEEIKNKINPILTSKHNKLVLNQLGCSSPFNYNTGTGIEYTTTLSYLTEDLLGFHIFSSYFCGGAHPDFGGEGNLIDLQTGKEFTLDEIIAFDTSVTVYSEKNFSRFAAYRNTYFAPKLFEIINLKENFETPKEEKEEEKEEENEEGEGFCNYTAITIWEFPEWNFTEKGIEFTPTFARFARNCQQPFLVEFEKIKTYKNPKFPYDF
ncbi:hypothetical protein [Flavobacterium sp. J27]|uniref:hypothetical protein n=1 Tax=Flavobacterium sp. J27 TaxID=2060419 RepID=UPI001032737D|nr:hypothetical protein [Flavobacterium sp. J27]